MSEYKFPAVEITVAYSDAADVSEMLKEFHPNIISLINTSDSVFDIMSPEATLDIPEIAKFIVESDDPEATETEIIALANSRDFSIGTRIIHSEDEMPQGEINI